MKNIDFLPARYYERGLERKARLWRLLVLLLFGGICAATALGQYALQRSVCRQVRQVENQYAAARATNNLLDQLQLQLRELRAAAELYTYLRHPWPRSQLLACLVEPLPDELSLGNVDIRDEVQAQRRAVRSAAAEGDEALAPTRLPAQQDLDLLRQRYDSGPTVIEVTGRAQNTTAVHQYVSRLAQSPLFAKTELMSLESLQEPSEGNTATFTVRIVVRPGYGQPHGPLEGEALPPDASPAAEEGIDDEAV